MVSDKLNKICVKHFKMHNITITRYYRTKQMGRCTAFMDWKTIDMPIPKLIYRFSVIPIEIPSGFSY